MKKRTLIVSLSVAALSLFAVGARAQHADHHPADQSPGGGMMGQGTGCHHARGQKLMNQLMQNMDALQNEKDPTARAKLMAQQCELLGKMHSEMVRHGKTTGDLMENCPIMGTNQAATDPAPGVEYGGGG